MKKFTMIAGAALAAALFAPSIASAAPGYVTTNLNVRAGPGTEYPAVAVYPSGSRVDVIGCTSGYGWCDVQGGGVRGWVSGAYLDLSYQSRRVRAPSYAARIGLPIVSFSIGTYWDDHYRNRSWYRDRDRFDNRRDRVERREDRREDRVEERREDRREDRVEDRRETRQERQVDRREIRQERREDRREIRQDRREDRRDIRQLRRQLRQN